MLGLLAGICIKGQSVCGADDFVITGPRILLAGAGFTVAVAILWGLLRARRP